MQETKMIPISKPVFGEEEINAINEVLTSGFVAQGKKVDEFKDEIMEDFNKT